MHEPATPQSRRHGPPPQISVMSLQAPDTVHFTSHRSGPGLHVKVPVQGLLASEHSTTVLVPPGMDLPVPPSSIGCGRLQLAELQVNTQLPLVHSMGQNPGLPWVPIPHAGEAPASGHPEVDEEELDPTDELDATDELAATDELDPALEELDAGAELLDGPCIAGPALLLIPPPTPSSELNPERSWQPRATGTMPSPKKPSKR